MAKKAPATKNRKQGAKGKARKKGGKRRKENIWIRIGRKLFGKKAEEVSKKYEAQNPLYVFDPETGERISRERPPEISDEEWKILKKVRRRTYCLEYAGQCSCCCFTIGKTTFIGFIPEIGPLIDVALGVLLVNLKAQKADLPLGMTLMMYLRHAISEGIGLVPILGDFWISYYKVNSRNWWALETYLKKRARERNRNDSLEY